MIRSGYVVILVPGLAVTVWMAVYLVVKALRVSRKAPYRPPEIPGEADQIEHWRGDRR